MFDFNQLKRRFFREVHNVVWDLQSGKAALQTDNGLISLEETESGFELKENPLDLSVNIPAFAIRSKIEDIKGGDIVITNGEALGFVVDNEYGIEDVQNRGVRIVRPNGEVGNNVIPSNAFLGQDGILVVKSLVNEFGGDGENSLLPLLLLKDDLGDNDLGMIIALQMMNKQGNSNSFGNMLPLMLMGDGLGCDGQGGMKELLLMSALSGQGLGGEGMNNLLPLLLLKDKGLNFGRGRNARQQFEGSSGDVWRA